MLSALKRLIESKKFWTLIIGVATMLGTKYGFQVDPTLVYMFGGLFAILLGAQGLQDQGSVAADKHVEAAIAARSVTPCAKCASTASAPSVAVSAVTTPGEYTKVEVKSQAGFARVGLLAGVSLMILVACGSAQFAGCAGCGGGPLPIPISDIVDCAKLEATPDFAGATAILVADVGDWGKMLADLGPLGIKYGVDVARCSAMELIQQYVLTKQPTTGTDKTSTWDPQTVAEAIRAAAKADIAKQRAAAGQAVPDRSVSFRTGKGKSL